MNALENYRLDANVPEKSPNLVGRGKLGEAKLKVGGQLPHQMYRKPPRLDLRLALVPYLYGMFFSLSKALR